eukprot:jgi/Hompol1/4769/HPOL_003869-RA
MNEQRLRCRYKNSVVPIGASLDSSSTLGQLKNEVAATTGIPADLQIIKLGFPPKQLASGLSDLEPLSACGIRDGEQLIIEQAERQLPQHPQLPESPSKPINATESASGGRSIDSAAVRVAGGYLVVRTMADDNSCLFSSVAYTAMRNEQSDGVPTDAIERSKAQSLREVVARDIMADSEEYSDAVLGRERSEYCKWIVRPESWGGAIELAVLARHLRTQISSIDVATGRIDCFGQGDYPTKVFVLYTGIHYDAIALTPEQGAPLEFDQTAFDQTDAAEIEQAALKLAEIWRKNRKYTDMANFTLKCGICLQGLVGQKEAQAHAKQTGHTSFTEY